MREQQVELYISITRLEGGFIVEYNGSDICGREVITTEAKLMKRVKEVLASDARPQEPEVLTE